MKEDQLMSIRDYRKRKKISQSELAIRVGVTQAYICNLENGKRVNPSVDLLLKLASELDVSVDTLIQICDKSMENPASPPLLDKSSMK